MAETLQSALFVFLMLVTISCQEDQIKPSFLDVTNAIEVKDHTLDGIVWLKMSDQSVCTGSFVSDSLVLTAAHCVKNVTSVSIIEEQNYPFISMQRVIANAISWKAHPSLNTEADGRFDVALVRFAPKTGLNKLAIAARPVSLGELVKFVGFGFGEVSRQMRNREFVQKGLGRKRIGSNHIQKIEDGELRFVGFLSQSEAQANGSQLGERSASVQGDSGGPLLNENGEIIGVSSVSEVVANAKGTILTHWSIFCDLNNPDAKEFLREELQMVD